MTNQQVNLTREELIHRLRQEGVVDAITARVLRMSRERIRQIGGNISEDENSSVTGYKPIDMEKFINDVRSGRWNHAELASMYGLRSAEDARRRMDKFGLLEDYRIARQEARLNSIRKRLAEFARTWKDRTGTAEYYTCDLVAYDQSLYSLAIRSGRLVEMSRELGMVYVTGESRLKNRNRNGEMAVVDENFERRRKV